MTVSEQTRDQVVAVLEHLVTTARVGGGSGLGGLASPEFSGFWIDRPLRGAEDLVAVLAEPFGLAEVEIACEGTVAWVRARLVIGSAPAAEGRFTAVLRGTGHAWLVAQVHASLPA